MWQQIAGELNTAHAAFVSGATGRNRQPARSAPFFPIAPSLPCAPPAPYRPRSRAAVRDEYRHCRTRGEQGSSVSACDGTDLSERCSAARSGRRDRDQALAWRRPRLWKRSIDSFGKGPVMTSFRDKSGRPSSLSPAWALLPPGSRKDRKLEQARRGQVRIRTITRFPTEGLKTKVAGTIDFVPVEPLSAPALSERLAEMAVEEAISEAQIGSGVHSPDRFSSRSRRSKLIGLSVKHSPNRRAPTTP